MNIFTHFGSFCETSRRFDLSSRSLGHVFPPRETARRQLLELCLNTTYFVHNNKFYQQTHGAAIWGPPVSPIVCNLYMENFEKIALSSAPSPLSMWLRYVDDTFVKIHEYDVDGFTAHINSIDSNIQFTTEPELNNKLPFLDLCIHVKEDGGTKITIYRKPTHTDQYLNFSSNHPLEHKRSVVRTLTHRAKEFVTTSEDQECELKHVHNALRTNGYTEWALVVPKQKPKTKPASTNKGNTRPPSIGLPYVQGLSERLSKTFRQHGVSVYHKPVNTLRSILVHPKDKTPKYKKCGVIYEITCDQDPAHVYIGETKRPLGKRFKELSCYVMLCHSANRMPLRSDVSRPH